MLVEFADDSLKLIETDEAATTALPVAVIVDVRQRLAILRAAPDLETLRNWRSFGLADGESEARDYIVSLAEQWLMSIQFHSSDGILKTVVLKINRKTMGGSSNGSS